ncbi:hypothetical protein [Subtercola boreus]|uniref:Uncharacterized protein n=1 Tax=Subtercola boreus TaxID=120213 RepID=A0A3E0WHB6_9MICO|nr:hypothetical protein [Subtercola boreus]RFA23542.1 hypothetical protein B7R24_01265 [Subtercola boreus]RFA23936.1 hypothetical protein B7R23_01265 [Subtercola boreus]RFA29635.1 hypothetical protein B7R25_01260 [Subtercola boreus]
MTEHELHAMWASARLQIILSQLGPIVLLTASVGLVMAGLGHQPTPIRLAAALILLSTGILGALVQFSAASEAQAIARDLEALDAPSAVSRRIVAQAGFASVVKYVTPVIFVLTFLALLWAIFAPVSMGGMQ